MMARDVGAVKCSQDSAVSGKYVGFSSLKNLYAKMLNNVGSGRRKQVECEKMPFQGKACSIGYINQGESHKYAQ
jgi:hypothetical protein